MTTRITLHRTPTGLLFARVNGRKIFDQRDRLIKVTRGRYEGNTLHTDQGQFTVWGGVECGTSANDWYVDAELNGSAPFTMKGYKSAAEAVREIIAGY